MACLEVKKRKGSRVEGGRVIQLPCLKIFLKEGERFGVVGGISITSNSSFLILPNLRDLEG